MPQLGDVFQNALMQQAFAVEAAAEGRDTGDGDRADQEGDVQHCLAPAEAPHLVQVQPVQVHVDDAGAHEQAQLEQRMVHHVLQRPVRGQAALPAQQHRHGKPHGDKADLADGGAGERTLEVHGKEGQQGAQEHGHRGKAEQQAPEGRVPVHQAGADNDQPEHAALGQDAGQQRRRGRRGDRVRLRQPDVQREHARLGREAEKRQPGRGRDDRRAAVNAHSLPQPVKGERSQLVPQQEEAHQRRQAADHRHGEIGAGRAHGAGRLLMRDPGIAGQGHDLKKDQGRIQVIRIENAEGRAQGQQIEEIVAVAVVIVREVFRGEQPRQHPHE